MKHNKIMSYLVALSVILFVSLGLAREGGKGGKGKMHKGPMAELGLSEEQQTQMKSLREAKMAKVKPLREKKKSIYIKMKEAAGSDASEADLRKNHDEMKQVQSELSDARFEHMLAVRKILNLEQRKKFQQMHENRMKKGPQLRGRHVDEDEDEE